jgi:hypothetical protein
LPTFGKKAVAFTFRVTNNLKYTTQKYEDFSGEWAN